MYFTVYQITNTVNGKIYVGMHITADLSDGYLGSGTLIRRAVKKYGPDAFDKVYLGIFDSFELMADFERELVNENFVARNDTYNLTLGGNGSWHYVNTMWTGDEREQSKRKRNGALAANALGANLKGSKAHSSLMNDPSYREEWHRRVKSNNARSFLGKSHTEETRSKMSASHLGKHLGEKNSNFGKRWMCRPGDRPMPVIASKQAELLLDGWTYGRKS